MCHSVAFSLSPVVPLSPFQINPGLSYSFLTFFSHFVCTYNICTICRRRILVEIASTLFQGCFIAKTSEVSEPHWDIRGTKNFVSWKRGWMISQLSAPYCGVFNVPSWCINWTPRSGVVNLYSSHIWWVWPSQPNRHYWNILWIEEAWITGITHGQLTWAVHVRSTITGSCNGLK